MNLLTFIKSRSVAELDHSKYQVTEVPWGVDPVSDEVLYEYQPYENLVVIEKYNLYLRMIELMKLPVYHKIVQRGFKVPINNPAAKNQHSITGIDIYEKFRGANNEHIESLYTSLLSAGFLESGKTSCFIKAMTGGIIMEPLKWLGGKADLARFIIGLRNGKFSEEIQPRKQYWSRIRKIFVDRSGEQFPIHLKDAANNKEESFDMTSILNALPSV